MANVCKGLLPEDKKKAASTLNKLLHDDDDDFDEGDLVGWSGWN